MARHIIFEVYCTRGCQAVRPSARSSMSVVDVTDDFDDDALDTTEFAKVIEHKTAANKAFTAGELSSALESWAEAIKVFEGRSGDEAQRLEKSKVHSNQAEAYLRRKEYDKARRCADSALDCDPINLKALFRRARALLAIGGPQELTMALDDIKQYQSKGGVLSAMDAGLLVTSEGKPLLPHAVRREPPQSEAKKSPPPPPLESDAEWNQKVADFKEQTRELVAGAAAEAKVDGEEVDAATQAEKKEEAIRAAQEVAAKAAEEPSGGGGGAAASSKPVVVERTEWLKALRDRKDRYSWLIDVYRTTVDDDRPGGPRQKRGDLSIPPHGLASRRASRLTILSDFLLFTKLCVARAVIPKAGWQFDDYCELAVSMLDKAFSPERSSATLRYGEAGSATALRAFAKLVCEEEEGLRAKVLRDINVACWGEDERGGDGHVLHRFTFERDEGIFDDVGGIETWKELNEALKKTRLGGA